MELVVQLCSPEYNTCWPAASCCWPGVLCVHMRVFVCASWYSEPLVGDRHSGGPREGPGTLEIGSWESEGTGASEWDRASRGAQQAASAVFCLLLGIRRAESQETPGRWDTSVQRPVWLNS